MKSIKLFSLIAFALIFMISAATAQNDKPVTQEKKKIIIIKKSIDDDGTEVIEKTVKEGEDIKDLDIEEINGEDIDVIIEKFGDKDGTKKCIKIITEGDESQHWMKHQDGHGMIKINVDIEEENGEKTVRIRKIGPDGEEKVFEWSGDGDLSEEIHKKLEEEGIELHQLDGKHPHGFLFNKNENEAFLGVVLKEKITVKNDNGEEEIIEEGGNEKGVPIGEIVDGSAAEEAGLLADDILTEIDGQVLKSFDDLVDALSSKKPGDEITIRYLRNDQSQTIKATLKPRSDFSKMKMMEFHGDEIDIHECGEGPHKFLFKGNENKAFLGVVMEKKITVENENGEEIENEEGISEKGAFVGDVVEGSAAEEAGLQSGDIITEIDGQKIQSFDDLVDALSDKEPGDKISIRYLRNDKSEKTKATLKANTEFSHFNKMKFHSKECEIIEGEDGKHICIIKSPGACHGQKKMIIIKKEKKNGEKEEKVEFKQPNVPIENTLVLEQVQIFPNPTEGLLHLQFKGEAQPTIVTITDISGKEIFYKEINDFSGEFSQQFDLEGAAKGTLILAIRQNDKIFTEKIILN